MNNEETDRNGGMMRQETGSLTRIVNGSQFENTNVMPRDIESLTLI